MQPATKIQLAALSGVPLIMVLGNSLLIPAFPEIQSQLEITQLEVGLIITVFSVSAGVTIPIVGFLSDKFGRKTILVPAAFLYAVGGLICGISPLLLEDSAYMGILVGRGIKGVGAGGTGPIAMALAGDLFQSGERSEAMGVLEAANGSGKIISPILGAAVVVWFWWASIFFVYTIFALPVAIMLWLILKEPEKKGQTQSQQGSYFGMIGQIWAKKKWFLMGVHLAGFAVLFSLFGTLSYLSDILELRYDLHGIMRGLVLAIPVTVMAVTSYLTGHFIQSKQVMGKLVVIGLAILAGSFVKLLLFLDNPVIFFAGIVLIGFGTGLVLTSVNTLVTSSASGKARGGITSLYGSVRFFGVAFGPPVFGYLVTFGRVFMFGSAGVLSLLVSALNIYTLKGGK